MPTVNASAIALLYCALLLHPLHFSFSSPSSANWHSPSACSSTARQQLKSLSSKRKHSELSLFISDK